MGRVYASHPARPESFGLSYPQPQKSYPSREGCESLWITTSFYWLTSLGSRPARAAKDAKDATRSPRRMRDLRIPRSSPPGDDGAMSISPHPGESASSRLGREVTDRGHRPRVIDALRSCSLVLRLVCGLRLFSRVTPSDSPWAILPLAALGAAAERRSVTSEPAILRSRYLCCRPCLQPLLWVLSTQWRSVPLRCLVACALHT